MERLAQGVSRFQKEYFEHHRELFEQLSKGQRPETLFITCSDSRIDPCLLTQTKPGELFIIRNAGNLVPPFGAIRGSEAGTLEYAVEILQVKEIIVCGHSQCGAMNGLLDPQAIRSLPSVAAWVAHAESTRRVLERKYAEITDPAALMDVAIRVNVMMQLNNLRTHPAVAAALAAGALRLFGWVYRLETGGVEMYDETVDKFRPLERAVRAMASQQEAT